MEFKDRLKELRMDLALTQKAVADGSCLSPQCISQLEMGTRAPTGYTLIALANFLECSTDYLLGREDDYGVITIKHENALDLTPNAKELLNIFNALETEHQLQILEYARYFSTWGGVKNLNIKNYKEKNR